MKPKVSAVVPTFNGYPKNKKCKESLPNQSLAPFEMIVVDNASSDDSKNLSEFITGKKKSEFGPSELVLICGSDRFFRGGKDLSQYDEEVEIGLLQPVC